MQFQNKCYRLLFTYLWTILYNCNQHKIGKFISGNNNIFNQHISDIFNLIRYFFDKQDLDLSLIGSICLMTLRENVDKTLLIA